MSGNGKIVLQVLNDDEVRAIDAKDADNPDVRYMVWLRGTTDRKGLEEMAQEFLQKKLHRVAKRISIKPSPNGECRTYLRAQMA